MATHDVIGDMLTKIRNASNAGQKKTDFPYSNIKYAITQILAEQGFLDGFEVIGDKKKRMIQVTLRYYNNKPVISGLKRISKPGRRIYRGGSDIPRMMNGLALTIVSTSRGILTGKKAKDLNIGGEVICCVW